LRAGLTQAQLAELMGKDDSTIHRWERGLLNINLSDMLRLAKIFDCPPSALIVDGDGMQKSERELIAFLRANPIHKKIILSQLEVLKDTIPHFSSE